MSANTSIEWATKTWNPVRGCSLVSDGCRQCYAMKQAHRFSGPGGPYQGLTEIGPAGPRWTGKIALVDDALEEPLHWRKPERIFVNSMSDLFHEAVPDEFIDRVFAVMALAPRHIFQILTKRAARMRRYFASFTSAAAADRAVRACIFAERSLRRRPTSQEFDAIESIQRGLPNVWLGVSVENQRTADERIPLLLQTPAAIRFVSAEPLLSETDLRRMWVKPSVAPGYAAPGHDVLLINALTPLKGAPSARLDWVIVGGESGPGARRCYVPNVRAVVKHCHAAGVRVFVKQLGAFVVDRNDAGFDGSDERSWPSEIEDRDGIEYDINGFREEHQGADCCIHLEDRKGGDPSEWPEDLRVRQFPQVREAVSA